MHVISSRNVNDAYLKGLALMLSDGVVAESRVGRVVRVPAPVTTVYERPMECVLFEETRNANPFFHLFEALWMLNGQNDVQTMDQFLPRLKQYSDDGDVYHGAYGYRWRHWPRYDRGFLDANVKFAALDYFDQIAWVINLLRSNPDDRRAVIAMWDPARDLGVQSKDIPCNDLIKLAIVQGRLDMVVFCRSNDIIYGCYGANAVHFAMLHQYLAAMIGVPQGQYWQISCDYHAYIDAPYKWLDYAPADPDGEIDSLIEGDWNNPYDVITHKPLVDDPRTFDRELREVMAVVRIGELHQHGTLDHLNNTFFPTVVVPMYAAFQMQKTDIPEAINILDRELSAAPRTIDWLESASRWLERKHERRTK